jgi:hypothetical protein
MKNRTKNAIDILNTQKSKLYSVTIDLNDGIWGAQLLSYIVTYFSENSVEYQFLSKTAFYTPEYNEDGKIPEGEVRMDRLKKINKAIDFIDNCIEKLKNTGVYKKPKTNILSSLSEGWLIFICGLIIAAMTGLFYIGYWYGEHNSSTAPFVTNQKSGK